MLTHWVLKAWKRLHSEYKDTIINTFQAVGLSLNPDGSQDEKLKVKGIPDLIVGDYARDDLLTQLEDSEQAMEVAEIEAACREAMEEKGEEDIGCQINEGDLDDEDGGIGTYVTDLLRPSRDNRRQPAQDRYFLSYEAEEGDPLLNEDPADATTDSESHLAGGWDEDDDEDEDEDFNPNEVMEDIEMVQKDRNMSL